MKQLLLGIVVIVTCVPLFAIDVPINGSDLAPALNGVAAPLAATAGSQTLVVETLSSGAVGTRVDPFGRLIDARPFPLFAEVGRVAEAIGTDGVGWIVVPTYGSSIAHIDPEGRVETHPWPHPGESYSISFSGSVYVMTYVSIADQYYAIHAVTLTRNGEVIADRELPVRADGIGSPMRLVVTEPNRALLVITNLGVLYLSAFDISAIAGNGEMLVPLRVSKTTVNPTIGWNGSELIMTYQPDEHVHVRRVNAGGVTAGAEFLLPANPFQILWTGSAWLMAYHDVFVPHDTFELRDLDGSLIRVITDPLPEFNDVLAPAGGNQLLAFTRDGSAQSYVHSFALSDPAQRTPDVLLSRAFPSQTQSQVARCGDEFRAVWIERSNANRLLTRRFALSGTPRGDAVTLADSGIDIGEPASIACTTDSTSVTWKDNSSHVHAAWLDRDNLPRRIVDLGKTSALGLASVATNGSEYVISFAKEDGSAVEMQRWSRDGIAIGFPASCTAFDLTDKFAGVVLAPVGDEYVGVVSRVYAMETGNRFLPIALIDRIESVRFSQSLVPQTTATPLTARNGSSVAHVSIRCENGLCAVPREQSPTLFGQYAYVVSRLKGTSESIDPPLSAKTIAPPDTLFFDFPTSDWIAGRLFVAANHAVSEVDAAGNVIPIVTLDANERVVAISHSDQDLVMFIQRPAADVTAQPRVFIRVTQARRHGAS